MPVRYPISTSRNRSLGSTVCITYAIGQSEARTLNQYRRLLLRALCEAPNHTQFPLDSQFCWLRRGSTTQSAHNFDHSQNGRDCRGSGFGRGNTQNEFNCHSPHRGAQALYRFSSWTPRISGRLHISWWSTTGKFHHGCITLWCSVSANGDIPTEHRHNVRTSLKLMYKKTGLLRACFSVLSLSR